MGWGGVQVCEGRFDSQLCGRRGGGWRGMRDWGGGGGGVEVCEGRFDS